MLPATTTYLSFQIIVITLIKIAPEQSMFLEKHFNCQRQMLTIDFDPKIMFFF